MERFGQCGRSSVWHQSSVWTPHVKHRRSCILAPLLAGIMSERSLPGSAFIVWDILAQRRCHMYRCAVYPVTFGYVPTLNFEGFWQRVRRPPPRYREGDVEEGNSATGRYPSPLP